jgi:hypothetical protein
MGPTRTCSLRKTALALTDTGSYNGQSFRNRIREGLPTIQMLSCRGGTFVERTNSHRSLLRDEIWNAPGVRDVATELRAVNS